MRVLLPSWKQTTTAAAESRSTSPTTTTTTTTGNSQEQHQHPPQEAQDSSSILGLQEEDSSSSRKRRASASLQDVEQRHPGSRDSSLSPPPHAKRHRLTQHQESASHTKKPPAKVNSMTAGGRFRRGSSNDDEQDDYDANQPEEEPHENEPQDSYGIVLVNSIKESPQQHFNDPNASDDPLHQQQQHPQDVTINNALSSQHLLACEEAVQEEVAFLSGLKRRGLEIVPQEGDGNCLFRAVALQVYGDANAHVDVRQQCLDFMAADPDHFGAFCITNTNNDDMSFQDYIARKRKLGVHGNNPELQALSELFNRPVEVFTPQAGADRPINIFHAVYKTSDAPIRLSYHDGNHYNAVVDPLVPTAGLGLGMPGLQPGLADKLQMAKAVKESDQLADQMEFKRAVKESQDDELHRISTSKDSKSSSSQSQQQNDDLQRALKESAFSMDHLYQNKALALSDLDATNFELEQTALAHSMESFRRNEHGRKQRAAPSPPANNNRNNNSNTNNSSNSRRRLRGAASSPVMLLPAVSNSAAAAAFIPPPSPPVAASAAAAVAARPLSLMNHGGSLPGGVNDDEYPQAVQELVMNGFPLSKVVHAYELIGDNFDDLLAFLMMNAT